MKVLMFTVRIWDLPTRLFHWLLVTSVIGLVISGNIGGDAMVWHFRFGYVVLTLLLFRVAWGLMGGHWSRWSQLPLHPSHIRAYLSGHADPREIVWTSGATESINLALKGAAHFYKRRVSTSLR